MFHKKIENIKKELQNLSSIKRFLARSLVSTLLMYAIVLIADQYIINDVYTSNIIAFILCTILWIVLCCFDKNHVAGISNEILAIILGAITIVKEILVVISNENEALFSDFLLIFGKEKTFEDVANAIYIFWIAPCLMSNLIISAFYIGKNFLQQKREDEKNKLEMEILVQKITELENKLNMLSTEENKK